MAKISQEIEFAVNQPGTVWRNDISLPEPLLRFPLDESHFCPQIFLLYGFSAGLTLYWGAVTGATFYVVQIADNTSFTGPNVRAVKTADTDIDLTYLEHLRVSDQFFWRVAAYNNAGGFSVMSQVRSIKIACPETQGVSYSNEGSPYADIASPQICDTTGVDIQLSGPQFVRKTDNERTYVLNVNYDCDSFEGHTVSISDVVWEIRQSSDVPVSIDIETEEYIKLDIDSEKEEWFEVIANVVFELSGVGTFNCKKQLKVLIEGRATESASSDIIEFSLIEVCCDTYTAIATVVAIPCTGSSVEVGDTICLFDNDKCHFIGANPEPSMWAGLRGKATKMEILASEVPPDGTTCFDPCEGAYNDGPYSECRWVVLTLCCPGNWCA